MLPVRLLVKDFGTHAFTEFSFNEFQNALVIGKIKDNDSRSNGSGKSTIFNAIEYVLFNEVQFSSLEKTIRDGCDICRVEYDFISALDNGLYRIIRSNSRKTGTDVRLFKQTSSDIWEDLTQRRVSDTEKEILKIIGFNYKSFCASVIFCQLGSENNVQKDFGNLPYLTPEKRKTVLREVLQLNIYSNYEKLAKSKYNNLLNDLEKNKIVLSTIGNPKEELELLQNEQVVLQKSIEESSDYLNDVKNKLNDLNVNFLNLSEKNNSNKHIISSLQEKLTYTTSQASKYSNIVQNMKDKLVKLPEEAKSIQEQISLLKLEYDKLNQNNININELNNNLKQLTDNLLINKNELLKILNEIIEYKKPISSEKICSHCHQIISDDFKHTWQQTSIKLLEELNNKKQIIESNIHNNELEIKSINSNIQLFNNNEKRKSFIEMQLNTFNSTLDFKRTHYKNANDLLNEHILLLESKGKEIKELEAALNKANSIVDNSILDQINECQDKINKLKEIEKNTNNKLNNFTGKKAILVHKIKQCELNIEKIDNINLSIKQNEKQLLLYSKVIQAFGSSGIPSIITHSILDDLQSEANGWLLKLRPGLQLQFIISNDKKNKEQEDTLDIYYFIDGNQREYKQLSGAEKIIVSLSIKLAIIFIMNKRLGINIKFMLLDEVDQALDQESINIFSNIIKTISQEFKMLVITHNNDLKHKFSHAILVEKDINNVSYGKLINW